MRYLLIIFYFAITSCSGINGKIEKRDKNCDESIPDSKEVYLVNKSTSLKYQFTVKKTEFKNDTTKSYKTDLYVLEPGEETNLGCDKWFGEIAYAKKQIRRKNTYWKVEMIFFDNSVGDIYVTDYKAALNSGAKLSTDTKSGENSYTGPYTSFDTLINGQHELYISYYIADSANPLPRDFYKTLFIITGQRELKGKTGN